MVSCRAKLQRADRAVEEFRKQIDLRKPENYGFASMAAVAYAHIVANMLRGKHPKGVTITLAPNPKDIVSFSFAAALAHGSSQTTRRSGRTWDGARPRSGAHKRSVGSGSSRSARSTRSRS